jgi:glycosyltransferase involved in cell wall biosynthesis
MIMKLYMCFLLWIILLYSNLLAEDRPTVCLNMIVKNETDVICRCLASTKPLIDYWVIVDTGSTDGTQQMIKDFMKDIPGELHERPWKNFAHNRNEALELVKRKSDYVLIIDADDVLEYPKDFKWPELNMDGYYIQVISNGIVLQRFHLLNNHLQWKWKGVLHEVVGSADAKKCKLIEGIIYRPIGGGARSNDPNKYLKDAQILEEALKEEPNNRRYVFYLAQSYFDGQNFSKAIENYEKRIGMGGWRDEIFWSKYKIAVTKEAMHVDEKEFIQAYEDAFNYYPTRVEPLYGLANYYRRNQKYHEGYYTALKGLQLKPSLTGMFVNAWMYIFGLTFEFSICAYHEGKYTESLLAANVLLENPYLPNDMKEPLNNHMKLIYAKFSEQIQKLN